MNDDARRENDRMERESQHNRTLAALGRIEKLLEQVLDRLPADLGMPE